MGDFSSSSFSRGLSSEAFEALPKVRFEGPSYNAEALTDLTVADLKRLMEVHGVSDAGCIERAHLVDALLEKAGRVAEPSSLPGISQPAQCAICMNGFKDGDTLRQLDCSDLHVFCNGCIQTWLERNTSCPLCRQECGPPAPAAEPPLSPFVPRGLGGPPLMAPIGIMASLGGPEHTFLLLDAPLGLGHHLDTFSGSAGRAFSRASTPAAAAPQAAPQAAPSRERAPSRGGAGLRLPPLQRPTRSSAAQHERALGASSGDAAAPPAPSQPANARRSSFLPSLRPLRLSNALPRLSSSSARASASRPRANNAAPPTVATHSSSVTGAGTSLSAAGSGRSFAARAVAARRRSSSSGTGPEDCVVL